MKLSRSPLLIFLLLLLCLTVFINQNTASNIEDPKFKIKIENLGSGWTAQKASNDDTFERIFIKSNEDKFTFIIYASLGKLKHELTDRYDSIMLKGNYHSPFSSNDIEEFGMKGKRNIYKYLYYDNSKKKNIDEYITFDLLFKDYKGDDEYFYLIYTYTTVENDIREADFKSRLIIEPPSVKFWETTFGIIFSSLLYLAAILGFITFSNKVIRKSFYGVKNGCITKSDIKKKSGSYEEIKKLVYKDILKDNPKSSGQEAAIDKWISNEYYNVCKRMMNKSLAILILSILGLVIFEVLIICFVPTRNTFEYIVMIVLPIFSVIAGFFYTIESAFLMFLGGD